MRMPWSVSIAGLLTIAALLCAQETASDPGKIARGRYLAEEIARCQDCHTPKMDNGSFIKSQWMKGTKLNVAPAAPVVGWHAVTPDITPNGALWKRWGDAGMVAFLETGKTPRGGNAGPPMPTYTLKHEDAEDIVAFLKSLQ